MPPKKGSKGKKSKGSKGSAKAGKVSPKPKGKSKPPEALDVAPKPPPKKEEPPPKLSKTVLDSMPQTFITVRRKKLTHYMNLGELATFLDVKKEIERCTQIPPEHQAIYYSMNGELMNESLTLYQSGFPSVRHPPTNPAAFYVSFRQPDLKFENVEVSDYLKPPIEAPHVIEGPGGSPASFPISDHAQKLLQELAIDHDIRR